MLPRIVHTKYSSKPQGTFLPRSLCGFAEISGQMSESFTFEVEYSTTFKQIETLRGLMLGFVQSERRDYQPLFDVVVVGKCPHRSLEFTFDIALRKRHTRTGKDDTQGRYYVQEQLATR
jgi:hypothetical protein